MPKESFSYICTLFNNPFITMQVEKTQDDVIREIQNNPDYVILSNSLSNPKFIKSLGKATFSQPLADLYIPKIFVQIISKLTPQHLENKVGNYVKVDFHLNEFLDDVGIKDRRGYHSHILDSIKTMQTISVQYEDKDTVLGYSLIPAYEFGKKKGHLILDIHENIVKEILQVSFNSNFSYLKKYLFKLSNSQAVKLFQFFVSWKNKGCVEMDLENFKKKFNYNTAGYTRFANLKLKVIDPAINDINEKTALNVSYEVLGTNLQGKKPRVEGLRFFVKEKKGSDTKPADTEILLIKDVLTDIVDGDKDSLFNTYSEIVINTFGVSPTVFFKMTDSYTEIQIKKAVDLTLKAKSKGKIENIAGFFVDALKNNYVDTEEVKQKEKAVKTTKLKELEQKRQLEQKNKEDEKRLKSAQEDEIVITKIKQDTGFRDTVWEKFKESFIGRSFSGRSLEEVLNNNMTRAAFLSEAKKLMS